MNLMKSLELGERIWSGAKVLSPPACAGSGKNPIRGRETGGVVNSWLGTSSPKNGRDRWHGRQRRKSGREGCDEFMTPSST